jgi:hypothetical protein
VATEQGSNGLLINDREQTRYVSASSWVSLADKVGPSPQLQCPRTEIQTDS